VADVTSALAAISEHGTAILDAAKNGAQAVLDFLHQKAHDAATAAGAPPPERGLVPSGEVTTVAGPVQTDPAVAQLSEQVATLTALVQKALGQATPATGAEESIGTDEGVTP
jgi:hypothetical protein